MTAKKIEAAKPPVLVVPGWGAPAFHTEWIASRLEHHGLEAVRLQFPRLGMGDLRESAEILAKNVADTMEATGARAVNLVGYSLGGLIARVYLQHLKGWTDVGRAVFVGSPQDGIYTGYPASFTTGGRQVRKGSRFMRELQSSGTCECGERRCLSIYLSRDGIIVPAESARLRCGYNLRMTWPVFHWGLVFNNEVIRSEAEFLAGSIPEGAVPGAQENEVSMENKVDTGQ